MIVLSWNKYFFLSSYHVLTIKYHVSNILSQDKNNLILYSKPSFVNRASKTWHNLVSNIQYFYVLYIIYANIFGKCHFKISFEVKKSSCFKRILFAQSKRIHLSISPNNKYQMLNYCLPLKLNFAELHKNCFSKRFYYFSKNAIIILRGATVDGIGGINAFLHNVISTTIHISTYCF